MERQSASTLLNEALPCASPSGPTAVPSFKSAPGEFSLLLAQKKEGKEKGTLLSPDRCASRRSRREKNSALRASNTFSLTP
jgi:hypothetical protein